MRKSLPRDSRVLKTLRKQGQAKTGDAEPESLPKMKRRIGPTALRMNERTEERTLLQWCFEAPRNFFQHVIHFLFLEVL